MLSISSIELLIADTINDAYNGTYRAPTFAGLDTSYTSGNYYSIHSFLTAGYYNSNQAWSGTSSVVMRGDPIMGKYDYGRNDINGGSGNDFIYSATGNYLVAWGEAGNDTIIAHSSLDGHGGDGNDVLVAGVDINGNASGNYLTAWKNQLANANNMTDAVLDSHFTIMNTNNTVYGDNGHDVLIAPGDGNNQLYGDGIYTTSAEGNDLIIAGNGNNTIYGGGGDDIIYVGSGQNEIYAGTGDDVVYADAIGSKLDGGDGFDIYSFAYKDSAVKIEEGFWSTAQNFEGVTGTDYADSISGSLADDYINGSSGNDTLLGGAGNDQLIGGAGNDDLYGGTGDDFYFVSGVFGSDYVFENANEGADDRVVFNDITLDNVLYGRDGNDLIFADSNMANGVVLKDWFVNFGVDSFWFTAGTDLYNYVTAEAMADAFGVTIPTGNAVANSLDVPAVADATTSDTMMNVGNDLAHLAVTVTGVDFCIDAIPAIC